MANRAAFEVSPDESPTISILDISTKECHLKESVLITEARMELLTLVIFCCKPGLQVFKRMAEM